MVAKVKITPGQDDRNDKLDSLLAKPLEKAPEETMKSFRFKRITHSTSVKLSW